MDSLAYLLLYAGGGLAALGGFLLLIGRIPGIDLGHLPGDLSWTSGDAEIHIPLATMLLLSLVLTALVNLVARLFR